MSGIFQTPAPKNEGIISYASGTAERRDLQHAIEEMRSQTADIPMYIDGKEIRTNVKKKISPPHDHKHVLGYYHEGGQEQVVQSIEAALRAKAQWENTSWENRAAIFLKAAELIAGPYRYAINAATMLGQSKNAYQAEIDSACELIDFLRFNVHFMTEIYREQPISANGIWNRLEYRPLEGFTYALTPFNFTAIAGNLPTSMAMMGNVVVWKPSETQIYAANMIMKILIEAGLPPGVINLVYVDGPTAGEIIFKHKDFAGIHFTGSTHVFKKIWKNIGENIDLYKTYPRLVGETGGKDFIVAHPSASAPQVATAIVRGAFEFQGQKCSAASRAYIPDNLWEEVKTLLLKDLSSVKMGGVENFSNFINAVIDEKSFTKITDFIEKARKNPKNEIIAGGKYDKSEGYFIEPTVILTRDPYSLTMCEEIFGPVITIYVYPENVFEKTLTVVDNTSPYALTGSIFAQDRYALELATQKLRHAAGNFYLNDKPTGAVVGQQPFGGARASGTNDKAGAKANLMRWVSMRTIKETFVTPTDYRYPFLADDFEIPF